VAAGGEGVERDVVGRTSADPDESVKALGFESAPQRVVSLVPSMTESLFDLGAGERLVGITDYCIHPEDKLAGLPRVGGPLSPDLDRIRTLRPDLILANREENGKAVVEALRAEGYKVWVTFPCTVRAAIDLLWAIIDLFRVPTQGIKLSVLETTFEWASLALASQTPARVFCPVWRQPPVGRPDWWMTINHATYTHDLLRLCGGENIFADRERRYPLAADLGEAPSEPPGIRDTRYPRIRPSELAEFAPEVILLPNEPFAFSEADVAAFEAFPDLPAVKNHRIHVVDGSLLAWPGTRLAKALAELPSLLQTTDPESA
jgi:iron complex transport system substrate-binding protein